MLDGAFALHAALGIQHAHVMTFTTPIDADIKGIAARWHPRFLLRARPVPWGSLDPVLALTAQTPHWSFTTACRTGRKSGRGASERWVLSALPVRSPEN